MKPGDKAVINSHRDLMMDRSKGKWINHQVTIVKLCKSGLYQVQTSDGTLISLSKYNLTPSP
jgi:hypothetical protein